MYPGIHAHVPVVGCLAGRLAVSRAVEETSTSGVSRTTSRHEVLCRGDGRRHRCGICESTFRGFASLTALLSSGYPLRAEEVTAMPSAKQLEQLWENHLKGEFETKDVEATLATMVEDAYVNHMPVNTGGRGKTAL